MGVPDSGRPPRDHQRVLRVVELEALEGRDQGHEVLLGLPRPRGEDVRTGNAEAPGEPHGGRLHGMEAQVEPPGRHAHAVGIDLQQIHHLAPRVLGADDDAVGPPRRAAQRRATARVLPPGVVLREPPRQQVVHREHQRTIQVAGHHRPRAVDQIGARALDLGAEAAGVEDEAPHRAPREPGRATRAEVRRREARQADALDPVERDAQIDGVARDAARADPRRGHVVRDDHARATTSKWISCRIWARVGAARSRSETIGSRSGHAIARSGSSKAIVRSAAAS